MSDFPSKKNLERGALYNPVQFHCPVKSIAWKSCLRNPTMWKLKRYPLFTHSTAVIGS